MAGRIRSIKPEILDDEKTAGLSHLEWRLFVSLWLIADDFGNLRGDPTYILGQCLWASGESRESVRKALEVLGGVGLVAPYAVRGQSYIAIMGWEKHQKVSHRGNPRIPGISQADSSPPENIRKSSGESPEVLLPDLRSPISDLRSSDVPESSGTQLESDGPEDDQEEESDTGPAIPPEAWTAADTLRGLVLADQPTNTIRKAPWGPEQTRGRRRSWANEFRLLFERDERTPKELGDVLRFVFRGQTGDAKFVVQSPTTLREKWDRITTQMTKARASPRLDLREGIRPTNLL